MQLRGRALAPTAQGPRFDHCNSFNILGREEGKKEEGTGINACVVELEWSIGQTMGTASWREGWQKEEGSGI